MIKRLTVRKADKLVRMGKPILAKLEADPRLAEAASSMKTTQSVLEAKVAALDAARTAEQLAHARRDEEQRLLAVEVREFGFIVLSVNGNHHNADPYLLYFPDGYGDAMQLTSDALADFARMLLSKLATETDPKILPRKERIEEALNRFVTAEAAYQEALRARNEAFAAVQAEKRNWTRGVIRARALAESSCHFERAYLRAIFSPIAQRRKGAAEESETEETPAAATTGPQIVPIPAPPQGQPEEEAA
jgi:hypothetical protein